MTEELVFQSASEEETDRFGVIVAESLDGGLVISLNGQLGSGKTRFVRSLCGALHVNTLQVNSPTFVLMQLYTDGRIPVAHFDTYRIGDAAEFLSIGAEDYLFDEEWLSVIEWGDRVAEVLPQDRLTISLTQISETGRRFTVHAGGPSSAAVLARMRVRIET